MDAPIILERMSFPEPVISMAVEPKTKSDQEKMGIALGRLAQEDPSFRVRTDEESGQTIIAGMGELHLDIIVDRMKREFNVEANVGKPQVAYRETIRKSTSRRLQARQAVGRQGPVRPRGDRAVADDRGRRGESGRQERLPVRQRDHRRRDPEGIHPGGREGHARNHHQRPAGRLPGRGRQGQAGVRLVPRRRLVGNGVQARRLDGVQGRLPQGRSRSCSSRS